MKSIHCFYTLLLVSCSSNAIELDVNSQSIKSCNNKSIYSIYITNETTLETNHIIWGDTLSSPPRALDLNNITKGYNIYQGWRRKRIYSSSFKLSPLTSYSVERAQGDATSYKLTVRTDNGGNISEVTPSGCP